MPNLCVLIRSLHGLYQPQFINNPNMPDLTKQCLLEVGKEEENSIVGYKKESPTFLMGIEKQSYQLRKFLHFIRDNS